MALAETARLIASYEFQNKGSAGINQATSQLGKLESASGKVVKGIGFLGSTISTALGVGLERAVSSGIGALTSAFHEGVASAEKLQTVQAQTAVAIRSTGGAAGLTAQDIRDLALHFEDISAVVDDKVIQSAENLLLTFTNIRKNAFAPTIQAALDINQRLGGGEEGLQSVMLRLGRAMNDPAKGLALLARSGISLDAATVKQILSLQKQNKLFDAQTLLLDAISKRYGGSFAASADTAAGRAARLHDALDDLRITFASAILPGIENVQAGLTKFLRDPETINALKNFGTQIASFLTPANVNKGIGALKDAFVAIKGIVANIPFGTIGTSLQIAGRGAKFLLDSFVALPSWVQTAVITGWGLNKLTGGVLGNVFTSFASGLIKGVLGINAGVVNINAATVNGGLPGAAAGSNTALNALKWIVGPLSAVLIGSEVAKGINDKVIAPAATGEQSAFDKFLQSNPTPAQIQKAIDAINDSQDLLKQPLSSIAQGLSNLPFIGDALGNVGPKLDAQKEVLLGLLDKANHPTPVPVLPVGPGQANVAHGGLGVGAATIIPKPPPPPITAAEFERILKTTPFIGTAQYKSIFEQFTTARPARGGDPFGQGFLSLVQQLKNPKVPAVMFEIKGHLAELANLEKYYIAHGDLRAAQKVQGVIDSVDRLIGVTQANHPATLAAQRATNAAIVRNAAITGEGSRRVANILGTVAAATARARDAISAGAARTAAHLSHIEGLDSATAANTGITARKKSLISVTVPITTYASFSVNALGNQLTHIDETLSSQYGGKVIPI
jgi:hypothetical protein